MSKSKFYQYQLGFLASNGMKFPSANTIISHLLGGSVSCAILVFGLGLLYWQNPQAIPKAVAEAVWPQPIALEAEALTAKAAIVYDPTTGKILFAKNAQEPLPLASLTKLMSAEAVLAEVKRGTSVTITSKDISAEGDWNFKVGESWPLDDLLRFGLVASSNDAMAAAAATLGPDVVAVMNLEAKKLGLEQTHFLNPTGLDLDLETAGGYGSARDVAMLTGIFLQKYPELFGATAAPKITIGKGDRMLSAESTALPLLAIPGLRGAKTGYTDLAGGNLVAAIDIEVGYPVIIAVLGSTRDGRFEDVKKLVEALRN